MSVEDLEKFENKEKELKEQDIDSEEEKFENLDFDFLADITLKLNVEAGRTQKLFIEILKLKEGDIIQLDKSTEDYLDIYINGTLFAIGEMVIVNEKYSVRLVDLV